MAEILDLEDRMIDFMNPWYDLELCPQMTVGLGQLSVILKE